MKTQQTTQKQTRVELDIADIEQFVERCLREDGVIDAVRDERGSFTIEFLLSENPELELLGAVACEEVTLNRSTQ
jgi:hypothetical protein